MDNEWKVDYYITAGDLAEGIRGNVRQIERALATTPNTEVYMLWDQAKDVKIGNDQKSLPYPSAGGSQVAWTTTGITTKLKADDSASDIVQSTFILDESTQKRNSGKPEVLKSFISSSIPKAQNALFFANHGNGILSGFNNADKTYSVIDADAQLEVIDLKSALSAANRKYDLISFDECLMATVEVAYELRDYTKFVVASQEVVPGDGNDYVGAFKEIKTKSPLAFATQLVTAYPIQNTAYEKANTLSAIDLSKVSDLIANLKAFSDACVAITDSTQWGTIGIAAQNSTNYKTKYLHDLGQFLTNVTKATTLSDAVKTAASNALGSLNTAVVVKSSATTGKAAVSSGLSIVLPATGTELKDLLNSYEDDFDTFLKGYQAKAPEFIPATGWDKFLTAFQKNAGIKNAVSQTSTEIAKPDSPDSKDRSSSSSSSISSTAGVSRNSVSSFLAVNNDLFSLTGDATSPGIEEYSLESLASFSAADLSFSLNPGYGSEGKVSLVLIRRTPGAADQILTSASGSPTTGLDLKLSSGITIDKDTLLQVVTDRELLNYDLKFTIASGLSIPSSTGSTPSTAILFNQDVFSSGNFLTSQTPERWFKYTTDRTVSGLPQDIQLYSTNKDGYFNLDIYVGNADGSISQESLTDSSGTEDVGITFLPTSNDTYYIKVSSTASELATNNLDFSLIASESSPGDGLPTISGLTPEEKEGGDGLVNNSANLANISAFISLKNDNISDYGYYDPQNPTALYSWKTGVLSSGATGAIDSAIAYQGSNAANTQDFYSIFSTTEAKSVGSSTVVNASVKGLQSFGIYATQKDGTILRSQDANGSITNVGNNTLATLGDSLEVSISSGIFQTNVPKSTKSKIDLLVASVGAYTKELLTYQVDGITGGLVVNGRLIDPTDKDYARYAVERASSGANKSFVGSFASTNTSWELEGEKLYGTIILTNTDAKSFLANNPMNQQNQANQNAWFSLGSANPDGLSHFTSLGNNTYGFEDTWGGGGNRDFNDLVFNLSSSQVNLV